MPAFDLLVNDCNHNHIFNVTFSLNCTFFYLSTIFCLHTIIGYQVFLSDTNNLHAIILFQLFLSNTNNLCMNHYKMISVKHIPIVLSDKLFLLGVQWRQFSAQVCFGMATKETQISHLLKN